MIQKYKFKLSGSRVTVDIDNVPFFLGAMRRRWLWFGLYQLKDKNGKLLADFDVETTGLFSRPRRILIRIRDSDVIQMNYNWKRANIDVVVKDNNFLFVFHSTFMVSIFRNDAQVGFIKIPRSELFYNKEYSLTLDTAKVDINTMLILVFGIIYKIEVMDRGSDAAEMGYSLCSLSPFQKELRPFDTHWPSS